MSKLVGKKKHIDVATRKMEAIVPIGTDQRPKFQGPCWNLVRETVTLKIIGMAYDVEYPIVEIYVIAENAVSLINGNKTKMESTINTKNMLLIGSLDFPWTP